MHPDDDSYTAPDDEPERRWWDGKERRGDAMQINELHDAVAELTQNVTWLCRLGKWTLTIMGGLFVVVLPMGINAAVSLDRNQIAQDKRLDAMESNVAALITGRQHIVDRAREDHRNCHTWQKGAL